jgi:hypothetical protein
MSADELAAFRAGQLVVRRGGLAGTNACATFHSDSYVRDVLADGLELLDLVPGGAKDVNQDVVLLRKPTVK